MKIAIIAAATSAGGAERVASTLANCWVNAGHTVRLITFEAPGTQPAFEIDRRVTLDQLDLLSISTTPLQAIRNNYRRMVIMRRRLRSFSPDVTLALTTEPNIIAVLAGIGARWPTVISERTHPAYYSLGTPWAYLRRVVYPFAHAIVVQTADISEWFKKSLGLTARIIPNPIDLDRFRPSLELATTGPRRKLVAVGRLDRAKGFDLLVNAFAYAAKHHLDWDLVVYGEGPERAALQRLIDSLDLRGRILLAGNITLVEQAYAGADLFVHPARFDGYSNAVQEALAAGNAVIATDCPGATSELLGGGRYGMLVPNEDACALADGLMQLMGNEARRTALAGSARDAVMPFEMGRVANRWLDLFRELIEQRTALRSRRSLR